MEVRGIKPYPTECLCYSVEKLRSGRDRFGEFRSNELAQNEEAHFTGPAEEATTV